MRKKWVSFLLALCLAVGTAFPTRAAAQAALRFSDVPADSWYAESVAWAVANGITNGTGESTFSPDDVCSRAQILTMIWRAYGAPAPEYSFNRFEDVPDDAYYLDATSWASEELVLDRVDDSFYPDAPCTRALAVSYLYRSQGFPAIAPSSVFSDVAPDSGAAQAVVWAVSHGVTTGTSETTFSPDSTCTRSEIVTFLYRMRDAFPPEGGWRAEPFQSAEEMMSALAGAFVFASGAGGWGTDMTVAADGSFTGSYHDSDMGDSGDSYPNGTLYFCSFEGKFTNPTQIDDYIWAVTLESFHNANEPGKETIEEDGVRYVESEAYGLEDGGGTQFLIYAPGMAVDEMPEDVTSWMNYRKVHKNGYMTRFCICNQKTLYPFFCD